jgi:hypothetical protein
VNTFGNTANLQATTTYTPMYGVTGYQTGTNVERVYRRVIALDIFDTAKVRVDDASSFPSAQVYSGRLSSDGACASISGVMDALLKELAADFPGVSGKTKTITVPIDRGSC